MSHTTCIFALRYRLTTLKPTGYEFEYEISENLSGTQPNFTPNHRPLVLFFNTASLRLPPCQIAEHSPPQTIPPVKCPSPETNQITQLGVGLLGGTTLRPRPTWQPTSGDGEVFAGFAHMRTTWPSSM
jgi:hypothetical protein